jgi:hypothetical protein
MRDGEGMSPPENVDACSVKEFLPLRKQRLGREDAES